MFQNWGFLITEIAILLIIAALLGLFIGWLIWGRAGQMKSCARCAERDEQDKLDAARNKATREAEFAQQKAEETATLLARHAEDQASESTSDVQEENHTQETAPSDSPVQTTLFEETEQGQTSQPIQLSAPRGDKADDLKKIKGIGPQLEKLCHSLGFYHFDQIAEWTEKEIAWVDENLGSFSGRVIRDDWVGQAQKLAAGEETEFSNRVQKGEVY